MKLKALLLIIGITSTQAKILDRTDLKFLLWENNSTSLRESNQRGLGGGLEYQLSSDFCSKMIPLFIEKINCNELENEIKNGLNKWSTVQSKIKFKKLDSSFQTVKHSQNLEYLNYDKKEFGLIKATKAIKQRNIYSEHGAEIDFHTIDSWDKESKEIAYFAYADLIWGNKKVKNLLGHNTNSANLLSTDIFFNTDPKICYYKSSSNIKELTYPKRCNKVLPFSFVVTHEVGHTLALDHIFENDTVMGKADDHNPIYQITEVDEYHLKRLYPTNSDDLDIIRSYEDEFLEDEYPEFDYR